MSTNDERIQKLKEYLAKQSDASESTTLRPAAEGLTVQHRVDTGFIPKKASDYDHDPYHATYQAFLLGRLLQDRQAFDACVPMLRQDYFDDRLRPLVRFILKHYHDYDQPPAPSIVQSAFKIRFPTGAIDGEECAPISTEYLTDAMAELFARKARENVLLEGIDILGRGGIEELDRRYAEAQMLRRTTALGFLGPTDIADMDLGQLSPRRWSYFGLLVRGYVSCVMGPGGTGKTSFALAVAISVALGRDLLCETENRVRKQGAVLYWNLEDPLEEMKLRLAGELRQRGVGREELSGKLFLMSGRDYPLCLAKGGNGAPMEITDTGPIIEMLRANRISVLVVDPLVNSHQVEGNSNSALAIVLDQFRRIAHEADVALLIIQHFKKGGHSGDAESSLGAVTITNSCRVVETLTTMSQEEAEALAVEPSRRRRYVKRDNAKMNLGAAPQSCEWFEFNTVALHNGTEEYPDGDTIGVLLPWTACSAAERSTWEQIHEALLAIDAGTGDKEFYSAAPQSSRWAGKIVMDKLEISEQAAKSLLKQWVAEGVLVSREYNSPSRNYGKAPRLAIDSAGMERLRLRLQRRT